MEPCFKYTTEQYEFVRESRKVLLDYCKTVSAKNFIDENSLFGRGSIRNLLVHIANVYEFWIAKNGLNKNIVFTEYSSIESIDDVIVLFDNVDVIMCEFIETFQLPEIKQIEYEINTIKSSVGRLKLFSHVITHEFHHKGQILSLSRHLGYIPVDTDIIR